MEETKSSRGLIIGLVVAVLAVAGLIVFALSSQQQETAAPSQTQTDTTSNTPATENDSASAPSESASITFTDNGFEPSTLSVKKGTVVTVKNESSNDVQFSSADHPTHLKNSEMNLKTLAPGESASYAASKAGTWGYHDHLDESKTGSITVTE